MRHSLDLFGVPPIVFPAKGVQLFTSQGLSVLPCYSWSCCGHDKQVPTGRNTLACSYSLVVLLVLNCVQDAVIWGIMRRWQTLESKKHLSWNSRCSERLWTASTGTIHSWHQGLFERSRCGETTHGSDSLLSLPAANGLKTVLEFRTNLLIQAWNICLTLGCNLKHLLDKCEFGAEM